MKLGCCTWNFTHPHFEAPYDDGVRTVGELGFQGVEMIVMNCAAASCGVSTGKQLFVRSKLRGMYP